MDIETFCVSVFLDIKTESKIGFRCVDPVTPNTQFMSLRIFVTKLLTDWFTGQTPVRRPSGVSTLHVGPEPKNSPLGNSVYTTLYSFPMSVGEEQNESTWNGYSHSTSSSFHMSGVGVPRRTSHLLSLSFSVSQSPYPPGADPDSFTRLLYPQILLSLGVIVFSLSSETSARRPQV